MPQAPGAASSSSPVPAPAEAPRILRKPGPLAPPSLDGLPRASTQSMAALSTTPSARPVEPASSREVTQPFIIHPGDGATQVAPWPPRPVDPGAVTAPIKTHVPAPASAPASAAAVVDTEPMRTIPGLQAPPPFVPPATAARPVDTQPMLTMPMAQPTPAPRATMPTVPPIPSAPAAPVAPAIAPTAATVVRHVEVEATAVVAPPSLPAPPPLAPVVRPVAPVAPVATLATDHTVVAAPKAASVPAVASEPTLVAPAPVATPAAPAAPTAPRFAPAMPTPAQVVTDALPVIAVPPPAPAPPAPRFAPALPTPAQVVTDVLPTMKPPAAAPAPAPAAATSFASSASSSASSPFGSTDGARPAWAAPAKAAVPAAVKPRRLEYASWWRQWCAALVDGVGSAAVVFGLVRLVLLALSIKPSTQGLIDAVHDNVLQLVPVAAAWPVGVALWHLVALAFGSTVGQRLLGLRLVDSHGHRAGPIRLVIRALVAGATSLFLIGPAWALLIDGRRRGFGDIVARTAAIHR